MMSEKKRERREEEDKEKEGEERRSEVNTNSFHTNINKEAEGPPSSCFCPGNLSIRIIG